MKDKPMTQHTQKITPSMSERDPWKGLRHLTWCVAFALAGCGTYPGVLPSSGPSLEAVQNSADATNPQGIQLLDVTPALAQRLVGAGNGQSSFAVPWGQSPQPDFSLGPGDVVEVSIWEAPPASLFGASSMDLRSGAATARVTVLPGQMVAADGTIDVPFAGSILVAGQTITAVQNAVVQRLKGKANQPQVVVRILQNATSNVTVVGEVSNSLRMPLTAKGERLLDALAAAGGVRQPVGKMSLQITRGDQVRSLPLERVIASPIENVFLQPGDVVTAFHQPFSLTVLGATGANRELDFEAQGISLAQALGRAGGLQDQRADARGIFIFRFEDPALLPGDNPGGLRTAQGKVPVVFRLDLKDPASFFSAQDFPMRHRDVVYVANSPAAELQKFLNIVGSVVGPVLTLRALSNP
jgi:polysaccharide export outer membrane protein